MQLHCKADNWGVCVRWFSTRNMAGLERGNLGFGEADRFQKFYRQKNEILQCLQDPIRRPIIRPLSDTTNDSRATAESRSTKCSRRDVQGLPKSKCLLRFALRCDSGTTLTTWRMAWRKQIFATGRISSSRSRPQTNTPFVHGDERLLITFSYHLYHF